MPPCREKGGCPYHFHCRAMCLLSPLIPNPTWLPVPPSPRMSIGLVGLSSTIVMLAYRDCCSKGKQCHRERTTCGAPWCLGVGNERCRVYRMIPLWHASAPSRPCSGCACLSIDVGWCVPCCAGVVVSSMQHLLCHCASNAMLGTGLSPCALLPVQYLGGCLLQHYG